MPCQDILCVKFWIREITPPSFPFRMRKWAESPCHMWKRKWLTASLQSKRLLQIDIKRSLKNVALKILYYYYCYFLEPKRVQGWRRLTYTRPTCANLAYTQLTHADLAYTRFTHAELAYTQLTCPDLAYTRRTHSDLASTWLPHADLAYTRLTHSLHMVLI